MEGHLSELLAYRYEGDLVTSEDQKVHSVVTVEALTDKFVKVSFKIGNGNYSFRGILSEEEEGILMRVQDVVTEHSIISGVKGFLFQKPHIHGGYINKLRSFYFHIYIDFFYGSFQEFYFLGKRQQNTYSELFKSEQLTI
jgi:hypothetical protein